MCNTGNRTEILLVKALDILRISKIINKILRYEKTTIQISFKLTPRKAILPF